MAEIAYEFTITLVLEPADTTEAGLDAIEDAILDAVCQHFGGHTTDDEGNQACPREFVAGYKRIEDEDEELPEPDPQDDFFDALRRALAEEEE